MVMNTIEETFIKAFVTRDRRESWLHRLAAPKTRTKQLHRLAHSFDRELDHRYMHDKENPPAHVALKVEQLLNAPDVVFRTIPDLCLPQLLPHRNAVVGCNRDVDVPIRVGFLCH